MIKASSPFEHGDERVSTNAVPETGNLVEVIVSSASMSVFVLDIFGMAELCTEQCELAIMTVTRTTERSCHAGWIEFTLGWAVTVFGGSQA